MKGYDPDGIAQTEADHFMKCPAVGSGSICAISALIEHVHDAEIEVCEGPAPTRDGQLQ